MAISTFEIKICAQKLCAQKDDFYKSGHILWGLLNHLIPLVAASNLFRLA